MKSVTRAQIQKELDKARNAKVSHRVPAFRQKNAALNAGRASQDWAQQWRSSLLAEMDKAGASSASVTADSVFFRHNGSEIKFTIFEFEGVRVAVAKRNSNNSKRFSLLTEGQKVKDLFF